MNCAVAVNLNNKHRMQLMDFASSNMNTIDLESAVRVGYSISVDPNYIHVRFSQMMVNLIYNGIRESEYCCVQITQFDIEDLTPVCKTIFIK